MERLLAPKGRGCKGDSWHAHHFQEDGPILEDKLPSKSNPILHSQHVHAIDPEAGDVVAARVELSRLGGARLRGAHAKVVVLDDEYDG